jgi:hypothetical protein
MTILVRAFSAPFSFLRVLCVEISSSGIEVAQFILTHHSRVSKNWRRITMFLRSIAGSCL